MIIHGKYESLTKNKQNMICISDLENDSDLLLLATAIKEISLEKNIPINVLIKAGEKVLRNISYKCYSKEIGALHLAFILADKGFLTINDSICEKK